MLKVVFFTDKAPLSKLISHTKVLLNRDTCTGRERLCIRMVLNGKECFSMVENMESECSLS